MIHQLLCVSSRFVLIVNTIPIIAEAIHMNGVIAVSKMDISAKNTHKTVLQLEYNNFIIPLTVIPSILKLIIFLTNISN